MISNLDIQSDLRLKFHGIRDQKARPTCLACASSDVHAYSHKLDVALSVEYLFHHSVKETQSANPNKGIPPGAVTKALETSGQPAEHEWPYLDELPDDLSLWTPPADVGQCWTGLLNFGLKSMADISSKILSGIPVVIGIKLTEQFYEEIPPTFIASKADDKNTDFNHAVVGLGYGQTPDGEGWVLARNSWGNWGDSGYVWLMEKYIADQFLWAGAI